jgi:HD-like signal output (HDOD) protein
MNNPLVAKLNHYLDSAAPFSSSVQAAMAEMSKQPVDLPAVCALLETDPVLIAAILRLANSPFYGFVREINTVSDAAMLLGVHSLKQLVISFSLMKRFSQAGKEGLGRQALWENSIAVAVASKILAREAGLDADVAFVAGVLSDIGLVVMDQCLAEEYQPVLAYRDRHSCSLVVAEQAVLKLDHGRVGAAAINQWGLPAIYSEVALCCDHSQEQPPKVPMVDLVHLAIVLIKGLWITTVPDSAMITLAPQTLTRLKLNWDQLEELLPEIDLSSREIIGRLLP